MNRWDDDAAVDQLRQLWFEGLSASQIALRIGGVTRNAVISKAHRLCLPMRDASKSRHGRTTPKHLKQYPPRRDAYAQVRHASEPDLGHPTGLPRPETNEVYVPHNERKSILDLAADDCRWPIGNPRDADFHFCNGKKHAGLPYCQHHAQRAYLPPVTATRTNHARQAPVATPVRETEDA